MAKALLGYVGGPDPRLLAEVAVLRRRVRELEAEMLRLRAENDALAAAVTPDDTLISLDVASDAAVLA
jgi:hypothetical protein